MRAFCGCDNRFDPTRRCGHTLGMTTHIRGTLILDLARFLVHLGHDPQPVFGDAGIDPPDGLNRDTRVPVEAPMVLLEAAARRLDMPDFGLKLAEFRGMPDLGPVALLIRESATLGDVLDTIARAFHLHSTALYLSVVDAAGAPVLRVDLLTSQHLPSRQSAEMIMCGIREMLRWVLGPDWRPAGVLFRHERALSDRVYLKHFGVVPDFGQEMNAIILAPTDPGRALTRTAPAIDKEARAILAAAEATPEVFLYRVRQLIVLTLPQNEARADRIAALLKVDRRTLHRRLSRQGLCHSALLEEVRRELARQYVLGGNRSMTEIAFLVGYESPAVFSRWYRKAFGMSPTRARTTERKHAPSEQSVPKYQISSADSP